MLQLNRAKFSANGNCGYVLKPQSMCQGEALGTPGHRDRAAPGRQGVTLALTPWPGLGGASVGATLLLLPPDTSIFSLC